MNIWRLNQGLQIIDPVEERDMLTTTTNERDHGIEISKDLKPHDLVCKVASTANRVLGMLRNTCLKEPRTLEKAVYH